MSGRLSRREMLKSISNGFPMMALSAMLAEDARAGAHFPAKAKNVLLLYMPGGVSHMDTFDPKPKLAELDGKPAEKENRKWIKSPWQFKQYGQAGIWVSDLFPHLSTCADELAIIRSMKSGFPLHPRGNLLFHTGRNVGGHPSMGSWITYALGSENKNLPGYVLLHTGASIPGGLENFSNGYLPATHQAMSVRPTEAAIDDIVPADKASGVQRAKLDALLAQDRKFSESTGRDDGIESAIANYELAYRMQSLAPDVLDLSKETAATRKLYGIDEGDSNKRNYALQCLRARRLIEAGVRFVEVNPPVLFGQNNGTWDQHTNLKKGHEGNALVTDQAVTALLKDMRSRGLLKETLVIWGTEFGRTPDSASDGRDHLETAFTIWMAGAGVKGGTVHGATDDIGKNAVENITDVHDLHATILHILGLDHERLTYRYGGRQMRLTDVHGHVVRPVLA